MLINRDFIIKYTKKVMNYDKTRRKLNETKKINYFNIY